MIPMALDWRSGVSVQSRMLKAGNVCGVWVSPFSPSPIAPSLGLREVSEVNGEMTDRPVRCKRGDRVLVQF